MTTIFRARTSAARRALDAIDNAEGFDVEKLLPLTSKNFQKGAAAIAAGTSVYHHSKKWVRDRKAKKQYTLTVKATQSDLFYVTQSWLLDQTLSSQHRSLQLQTRGSRREYWDDGPGRPTQRDVVAFLRGGFEQELLINGKKIHCYVNDDAPEGMTGATVSSITGSAREVPSMKIDFICPDEDARDSLILKLQDLLREHDKSLEAESFPFQMDKHGNWLQSPNSARRPLSSVHFPGTLLEDVVDDFDRFLRSAEKYVILGAPWHRGYMFYGPPGTGKSSLAVALSDHFSLDLYSISLPDLQMDADLSSAVSRMKTPSILLIEDIDVSSASKSRDDEFGKSSLSGLLNILDGALTPTGMITIITSNMPEVLDEALVRSGRIDYKLECPLMNDDSFAKLTRATLGSSPDFKLASDIIPSDAVEILKKNIDEDPENVMKKLKDEFG